MYVKEMTLFFSNQRSPHSHSSSSKEHLFLEKNSQISNLRIHSKSLIGDLMAYTLAPGAANDKCVIFDRFSKPKSIDNHNNKIKQCNVFDIHEDVNRFPPPKVLNSNNGTIENHDKILEMKTIISTNNSNEEKSLDVLNECMASFRELVCETSSSANVLVTGSGDTVVTKALPKSKKKKRKAKTPNTKSFIANYNFM